jgi:hypothetical protein
MKFTRRGLLTLLAGAPIAPTLAQPVIVRYVYRAKLDKRDFPGIDIAELDRRLAERQRQFVELLDRDRGAS